MNKKAIMMQSLAGLITMLVGAIIVMAVSSSLFSSVDEGLQDSICTFHISTAKAIQEGEFKEGVGLGGYLWKSADSETAKQSLKKPFCTTKVHTIDLTGADNDYEELAQATIEIGEMIENCWSTFGEGRVINTFGQSEKGFLDINIPFMGNKENYYFNCYSFTVDSDSKKPLNVTHLKSLLFTSNLKGEALFTKNGDYVAGGTGKKLSKDVVEEIMSKNINSESMDAELIKLIEHYEKDPSRDNTPYFGFVSWQANGYLEFVDSIGYKPVSQATKLSAAKNAALGGAASGAGISLFVPVIGPIAGSVIGATIGLVEGYSSTSDLIYPNPLDESKVIEIGKWYQVRYYSPYFDGTPAGMVMNNIKIVPMGTPGGTEVVPMSMSQ